MVRYSPMKGAIAAGKPPTVHAGVRLLEEGGNAFDAAVGCALAAMVTEPLMTSFGAGGLATCFRDGRAEVLNFFSRVPGLGRKESLNTDFHRVVVDYGPTQQAFFIGPRSVAVPGIAVGLETLHQRYGRLPLATVVAPAIELARTGVAVQPAASEVWGILWNILSLTSESANFFGDGSSAHPPGMLQQNPELVSTLELFASEGSLPFREGDIATAMVEQFGGEYGNLTAEDLRSMGATVQQPIAARFGDATLYLPPAPAAGGALLSFGLGLMERQAIPSGPPAEAAWALAELQRVTNMAREQGQFDSRMQDGAYIERFLSADSLDHWARELGAERAVPSLLPDGPGSTTHISVVDEDGNAVSYTTSTGESCGHFLSGTGILMNNFLGEEDVNPLGPGAQPAGTPLQTMMTPTLLQAPDGSFSALGTGGSNRIRSAILQVCSWLLRGQSAQEAIDRPRIHVEGDEYAIETVGWDPGGVEYLEEKVRHAGGRWAPFKEKALYFGGINLAKRNADGSFEAVGDERRAGKGVVVGSP